MDKKSMLEAIISHYTEGNKARFASLLGVSAQTISAWGARNTFDSELIYTKCSEISADWLLSGIGSMLRSNQTHPVAQPTVQQDSSPGEAAVYYKMYKEEKDENKALLKENGRLEERVRHLESREQSPDHPPLAFNNGLEDFTEAPSGGSTKDYAHMRKPTTIKRSSTSKT